MSRLFVAACLLLCLFLSSNVFAQSSTLSGTVADATGALIPGVTITATNVATGVASTTLTNEAGAYNFPSIQPGVYRVTADLSGFQPQTFTDVQIGTSIQVRQNFTLTVRGVAQAVEVSIAADSLITASSPSIGQVLPEQKIRDLPIVGNNVLDL